MRPEEFKDLMKKLEQISEGDVVKGPWQEKPPVVDIDNEEPEDEDDVQYSQSFPRGKEYQILYRLGVEFTDRPQSFNQLLDTANKLNGNTAIWHIQKALGRELKSYELTDTLEDYQGSPYPTMKYREKPREETFILKVSRNVPIHDIFIIPAGSRFLCNSHPSMNYVVSWAAIG